MIKPKYCTVCGRPLESRLIEGRQRQQCPSCGWIAYRQLKTGAGTLIEINGELLLFRRNHEPFKGQWNIPAGYCEVDEHPMETAVRETLEETGLDVKVTDLFDVYFYDDDSRGNGIMLIYRCEVIGGMLHASSEGDSFQTFPADQLPTDLAGGAHDQTILGWRDWKLRG